MARPIAFLAFANNMESPYLKLTEEDDAIYRSIRSVAEVDFMIHRDQYTSANEMIDFIQLYKNQISIFHFGGHAGDGMLHLADQKAAGKGFSSLLGRQKYLRCVFLNGCQTIDLVDNLLSKGVPVVIATNRDVENNAAVQFAEKFYASMASGETIEDSFEDARNATSTKHDIEIVKRHSGAARLNKKNIDEPFAWGIYAKNESALKWKIENARTDVLGLTKESWPRFLLMGVILLGIFSWIYYHLGSVFTAILLGGGVFLGGAGMITKFLLSAHKPVKDSLNEIKESLSAFIFKPPAIIFCGVILAALLVFGSSVELEYDDPEEPELVLESVEGRPIGHKRLRANRAKHARYVFFRNPLSNKRKIRINGYHPEQWKSNLLFRKKLSTRDLKIKSSLLLRLDAADVSNANWIEVKIERKSGDVIRDTVKKASIMIGPQRTFHDTIIQRWQKEYLAKGWLEPLRDRYIEKWSSPNMITPETAFLPGEKIKITWRLNESIKEKEIEILNKRINDVLLEKCID